MNIFSTYTQFLDSSFSCGLTGFKFLILRTPKLIFQFRLLPWILDSSRWLNSSFIPQHDNPPSPVLPILVTSNPILKIHSAQKPRSHSCLTNSLPPQDNMPVNPVGFRMYPTSSHLFPHPSYHPVQAISSSPGLLSMAPMHLYSLGSIQQSVWA